MSKLGGYSVSYLDKHKPQIQSPYSKDAMPMSSKAGVLNFLSKFC